MSNRKVSTDALETLGTLIDDKQKRDAIHLAVAPVIAGEKLQPGDHITIADGTAMFADIGSGTGIVDPFLPGPVKKGQRFWFVMYPRMVHSLRHVWSHPAFPDEGDVAAPVVPAQDAKAVSEAWLRNFCKTADCPGYEVVIGKIAEGNPDTFDDDYLHFDGSDAHGEIPPEFWGHVEVVLGYPVRNKPAHFSCSC